jgi:hypothetical protein
MRKLAWPFGLERFITAPTVIGDCSPSNPIPIGYSSGMNPIFLQVAKSPIEIGAAKRRPYLRLKAGFSASR